MSNFIVLKKREKVIDFGTGCGIIPLMIYDKEKNNEIYAIEIQEKLAKLALKNVEINNLQQEIHIINNDIKNLKNVFPGEKFNVITANPPFMSLGRGKQNSTEDQLLARHEINIDLDSIFQISNYLLKRRGRLYIIHRADYLVPLIVKLKNNNLEPKLINIVYTKQGQSAKRVLIEARKDGGTELKILPPLYLKN